MDSIVSLITCDSLGVNNAIDRVIDHVRIKRSDLSPRCTLMVAKDRYSVYCTKQYSQNGFEAPFGDLGQRMRFIV